jgi:GntR family transcriptional regulator
MKNVVVRTTSQIPIYQQLYDQISSQILNGDLASDSLLPSIRVMAKELRVSIITIKKTWELLERNGYIYTVKGKGSYVEKSTKASLDKKKIDTIKKSLKEDISLYKTMGITKEELIELITELYHQK